MLKENKEEVKLFLPVPTSAHQAPPNPAAGTHGRTQGTLKEKEAGGERRKVKLFFCTPHPYLKQKVSLEA